MTFGQPEWQVKQHRATMKPLASLGHDPKDRLRAMDLAQAYGKELYTGVLYRNPEPPATYEALVHQRQQVLGRDAPRRQDVLNAFIQK